ncbi:SCO family protein [Alteromonas stellipolaris]|uniref:SCO family protein n=1 Tax=Alteromonas stellipolaris TaxID=233316 RepID=UPI0026E4695F|nr:SCO family protein [Alteromonas stellipolaris]MDO6533514.1 SCO family protein [Alteromonas stellipolaris]MDO6625492.1 SCO family protein [Alteromonas stellipolaris]
MNRRIFVGVVALLALLTGVFGAIYLSPTGQSNGSSPEYFQAYPEPRAIAPFSLTDSKGKEFNQASLENQWSLLFLGYTFCPDICPTTMAELNSIYPQMQAIDSEFPIKVVFISIDPNRDSIARLDEYISYFNPNFIAATGEHKALFPFARNLGMMYAIAESTDNPNYLVDHSASVILINPKAQVIGRFKPKREPGKLSISDAQQILNDMPGITSSFNLNSAL